MRIAFLAVTALLVGSSGAIASDWTKQLFTLTKHDFGTVARAAKTEFRFEFENRTNQVIHVRSVRASCGCTTPIIETETVNPGERGSILARFNTLTHTGKRQATITVSFDRPSYSEIQLQVNGYIRSDIVFNPGEIAFGTFPEGEEKEALVDIDYAGRNDWQVLGVRCGDSSISGNVKEVSRGGGRVKYQLKVKLDGTAPSGPLLTEVLIETNDRNLKVVPLRLIANIEPAIAISPPLLSLGDIKPGQAVKQVLILKGRQPFNIVDLSSDRFDIEFDRTTEPKILHQLPLLISPRNGTGSQQGDIIVKTDLPGDSQVSVKATYHIKSQNPE